MAESVGLFDRNAYENVICHGLILDDQGKKMSKHKAIADPWRVFDTYGSDVLRFYFFSAGDPADSRRLSEDALKQVVRGPFLTLWNVYKLYVMYANIDQFDPNRWEPIAPHFRPAIDRWILAELQALISEVDEALTSYDSLSGSRAIAAGMAAVRELASLGHSARRSAGVKVRQPLSRAVLLVPFDLVDAVTDLGDILADELNVDEIEFAEEASDLVRVTLKPNFPVA